MKGRSTSEGRIRDVRLGLFGVALSVSTTVVECKGLQSGYGVRRGGFFGGWETACS